MKVDATAVLVNYFADAHHLVDVNARQPAAAMVEEIVLQWLVELFGLPRSTGMGFVTGGQMANTTCIAAARQAVLARVGWDVAAKGLSSAPRVAVIVSDETHVTVYGALRLLGLGDSSAVAVGCDGEGRILADALRDELRNNAGAPTIVCAQVGNVNTGSFDPLASIAQLVREHENGWLHVDGAFGLWAAASPRYRQHLAGLDGADSWATDAHKWLNVPYDSGLAFVRDRAAHRAAMARTAAYLQRSSTDRDNYEWTPEFSRRARGFTVYAALRSLGRAGIAELVERCCDHARLFAELLTAAPGVRVVNEVVLNQVLVRFERPRGNPRGQRRLDPRSHRARAARGDLLALWHRVARPRTDAHLGVQLEHHDGGCPALGRGDPLRAPARMSSRLDRARLQPTSRIS